MRKLKKDLLTIEDFVGTTSGSPSRRTSEYHAVVGQTELNLILKTDVEVTLTIHEGVSESATPSISNSAYQESYTVAAGDTIKITNFKITGKWIMTDVLPTSGNAVIEIFCTANAGTGE